MPGFSFTTIEPSQMGQVTKWDVPLNVWIGQKFSNGNTDTLGNAISRATEDFIWDDHNPVRPDVLNRTWGIEGEGGLKFDKPMSAQRAALMHDRKRKELESLAYIQSASHSWHSGKAAIGFGAALVGGLSHPVDLGLAFLPFIGSEKAATEVAGLGGAAWRQSLARGVFTEEAALAARIPGGRLTTAVIDGMVNQAVLEIPVALQKHRDQAIYGLEDAAFNIVAGGAFAGAVKGIGLALEKAARLWREADPRMREAMLTDTLRSVATDEPPRAHWAFGMDEAAIREKVNERVRAENPAAAEYNANELLILARQRASAADVNAPIFKRLIERFENGERSVVLFQQIAALSDGIYVPAKPGIADASFGKVENAATKALRTERFQIENALSEIKQRATAESDEVLVKTLRSNAYRLETRLSQINAELEGAGKPLTPVEIERHRQEMDAAIQLSPEAQSIRESATSDFLTRASAEHEARIKGIVDAETQKVIDEVKRQSPPMPREQVDRYQFKSVPDEKNVAAIEEDTAVIQKTVLNLAQTEEARAKLETEIKHGLKELEEQPSPDKAIDAMMPCVTERAKK